MLSESVESSWVLLTGELGRIQSSGVFGIWVVVVVGNGMGTKERGELAPLGPGRTHGRFQIDFYENNGERGFFYLLRTSGQVKNTNQRERTEFHRRK